MHMKLLVLAALLAFFQSSVPPPRQSTNAHTGARRAVNDDASSKQAPPVQPPPALNAAASQGNQGYSNAKTANNEPEQPIRIGEVPPITVRTGPSEILYLVFSGLLVTVGGLQVWLLRSTLRAIQTQANHMERQAGIMDGQLGAMKDAGEQTNKLIAHAERQVGALLASATAMQKSVAFQQAALEQWVELVNWRTSFLPQRDNRPPYLRIMVDIVNPSNFPLTLKSAYISFAGNARFLFSDDFLLTPRNPYTVDMAITLSDDLWKSYWQSRGIWIQVEGRLPYSGSLRELQPNPFCGHLVCAHKWETRFESETPTVQDQNPS